MAAPPRTSDPRSDGELARAAQAGGDGAPSAMAAIYDRFSQPLYGFSASVLRNPTEAADAVQDVFIVAMRRIATLQDPEKLRSWLFSIARYDAMARVRKRARLDDGEVPDMASSNQSPEQLVAADEVARVVWEATLGLNERDRAIIELNVRHGLEGAELAEALSMTPSTSYVVLSRAKDQMARAVGALLLARGNRKECDELAALLIGWDGRFSPLIRKRISRHADDCDDCSRRSVAVARALSALAAVPVLSPPAALRAQVLGRLALVGGSGSAVATAGRSTHASQPAGEPSASHWRDTSWNADGFPEGDAPEIPLGEPANADGGAPRSALHGLRRLVAIGGVLVLVVGGATALVSSRHDDTPRNLAVTDSTVASVPSAVASVSSRSAAPTSIAALSTVAVSTAGPPTVATTAPEAEPTTSASIQATTSTTTTRPSSFAPSTTAASGSGLRLGSGSTTIASTVGRRPGGTTTKAFRRLAPTTASVTSTPVRPATTIRAQTTVVAVTAPPPGAATSTVATTTEAARTTTSTPPSSTSFATSTEVAATTLTATTSAQVDTTTTNPPTTTQPAPTTTRPVPSTTLQPTTTAAPSTTTTTTTIAATTTTTPFVVISADHSPDVIKVVPCQTGPTETVLFVVTNGGAAPYVAKAFLSNGAEVELPSSGPNTFKSVVGGFKSNQIGSYTWIVKVTDANGTTASKANGSKIVVNPCT